MAVAAVRGKFSSPPIAGGTGIVLAAVSAATFVSRGAPEALAVALLPAVIAAFLRSVWISFAAVVLVVCLVPFATLPLGGPVTPTLLELTLVTAFALQGSLLLIDRRQRLKVGGAQALWVLLVGSIGFTFALGLGRGYTTETEHTFLTFLLAIGSVWLSLQIVDRAADAVAVLRLIVGSAFAAAVLALGLYASGPGLTLRALSRLVPYGYPGSGIVRYIEDDPTRPMRAIGTSVDPNAFGGMLMIGFVLAVAALVARQQWLPRWIALSALTLTGFTLLLTYSRGAWLGAMAGAIVVIAVRRPRWLVPLVGAGAAAITLGLGRGFVERLWLGFTLQDPATKLRLREYHNAWAIIRQHPWFGVGFGSATSIDQQTGVSSIYLTLAERTGLLGLSAFLLVIGTILWRTMPLVRDAGAVGDASLAGLAALVAALTSGVVDHYYVNPQFAHMSTLFWIVAGLLLALQRIPAASESLQVGQLAVTLTTEFPRTGIDGPSARMEG